MNDMIQVSGHSTLFVDLKGLALFLCRTRFYLGHVVVVFQLQEAHLFDKNFCVK
jgi:hypothetical protein